MTDRIESRVAVNTDNIEDLKREVARARERLHGLESAASGVAMLTRRVEDLHEQLPNLARQAAREAVTEYLKRQSAERFDHWRTYAAVASAGIALGALIVALVLR